MDALFGGFWPEGRQTAGRGRPRVLLAALLIGIGAAVVLPHRAPGSGLLVVLLIGAALAASPMWRRASADQRAYAGLVLILISMVPVRDAGWAVALSLLTAAMLAAATLCRARTVAGGLVAILVVPLAALRGLPWLGRTLAAGRRGWLTGPVLRTMIISALLVVVFVALFGAADALFASWVSRLVPDLRHRHPGPADGGRVRRRDGAGRVLRGRQPAQGRARGTAGRAVRCGGSSGWSRSCA